MDNPWAGEFGDEYMERNNPDDLYDLRHQFWREIEKKYAPKRVLEVGCNAGHNLSCFLMASTYGIDVNIKALSDGRRRDTLINIIEGEADDIPFKDGYFDFVFSCGLLIHLDAETLRKCQAEIVRVASKYVCSIEYEAGREKKIEYRDKVGLWKRPYGKLYTKRFGLEIIEGRDLTRLEGFDNTRMWIMRK